MPIELFNLTPSRNFIRYIFILYALFILSFVFSVLPKNILVILILICLINFFLSLKNQSQWKMISWDKDNGWKIYNKYFHSYQIKLLRDSHCSRFLVILNFLKENKRMSLIVLPDSMTKENFKRLRIYLLNGKGV
jgi:hypothetical protein